MNPSNTWKGKLEAASFFCHLKSCTGSVKHNLPSAYLKLHYLLLLYNVFRKRICISTAWFDFLRNEGHNVIQHLPMLLH